jgi:hypothetical protein
MNFYFSWQNGVRINKHKVATTRKYKILITSALSTKNVRLKAPKGYKREKLSPYGGGFFCLMCTVHIEVKSTEMQWRRDSPILSHEALA